MTEILEKDKENLLTEIAGAGSAEAAVPVLEKEVDKLLLMHNDAAESDAERDAAAHIMQAVRLSLPMIDSIGYTRVWERGKNRSEEEDGGGLSVTSLLMLLGGVVLIVYGLFPLIMVGLDQTKSDDMAAFIVRCASILMGMIFLYLSGSVYGKPKSRGKKEYQVEMRVDSERIFRYFRSVIVSVDQSLDEVRLTEKQVRREQAGLIDGRTVTEAELDLFSDLLAASYSGDPELALEKIEAIKYFLHKQQIEVVDYSPDTKDWFDLMPGKKKGTIRPAMTANGALLRKGLASSGK